MVDRVMAAVHQGTGLRALIADPQLAAADRRMIKTYLLHWLSANVQDPGAPVAPCVVIIWSDSADDAAGSP
jgi:hypothetical protein